MTNHLPGDERAGQKAWALELMVGGSGAEEENEELRTRFSAAAPEGERLCACFSDEELLALLRAAGEKLGRSPAQGEVHWLLRDYLRARFRNWPGALRAAGMSRSAGRGGVSVQQAAREAGEVDQLLELVRTQAAALGRMPHPSELPEVCRKLSKRYKSWGQVLEAAGAEAAAAGALRKAADLTREEGRMLDELRTLARTLNRPPLRSEVEEGLRTALIQRFGSWRSVLYQIDLEPVRRITPFVNAPLHQNQERRRGLHRSDLYDCHYRLLRLDRQTEADLEQVRALTLQLGRPPARREVPPEIRRRLQKACGSWSNALFQLGLDGEADG